MQPHLCNPGNPEGHLVLHSICLLGQVKALAVRDDETHCGWDLIMWPAVKKCRCTSQRAFSLCFNDGMTGFSVRNVGLI